MELKPDIEVVIDELDLTGVPAARRHQVAATFERELSALLAARGLPRSAPVSPTEGGARQVRVALPLDANPVMLGQALAASVYEGLR